jgi:hypothetical protein
MFCRWLSLSERCLSYCSSPDHGGETDDGAAAADDGDDADDADALLRMPDPRHTSYNGVGVGGDEINTRKGKKGTGKQA